VGENRYKSNMSTKTMPVWVTKSDEAVVILMIENCWDQVCDIVVRKRMSATSFRDANEKRMVQRLDPLPDGEKAAECKYTSGGAGCKDVQGWRSEGIERFNELVDAVAYVRDSAKGKTFYGNLMQRQMMLREGKNKRKRKAATVQVEPSGRTDWQTEGVDDDADKFDSFELVIRNGKHYRRTPFGEVEEVVRTVEV
jgi:hypothetical protein